MFMKNNDLVKNVKSAEKKAGKDIKIILMINDVMINRLIIIKILIY